MPGYPQGFIIAGEFYASRVTREIQSSLLGLKIKGYQCNLVFLDFYMHFHLIICILFLKIFRDFYFLIKNWFLAFF